MINHFLSLGDVAFVFCFRAKEKLKIDRGKEPEKLPPVLSREEIARFLNAVAGLRNRVALTTAYAAGLPIQSRTPLFIWPAHGVALGFIGIEQAGGCPAVKVGREFPAEIDDIVEPVVKAISAVRRMRMRGVAGDPMIAESTSRPISAPPAPPIGPPIKVPIAENIRVAMWLPQ